MGEEEIIINNLVSKFRGEPEEDDTVNVKTASIRFNMGFYANLLAFAETANLSFNEAVIQLVTIGHRSVCDRLSVEENRAIEEKAVAWMQSFYQSRKGGKS